jgi:hypothetical protein
MQWVPLQNCRREVTLRQGYRTLGDQHVLLGPRIPSGECHDNPLQLSQVASIHCVHIGAVCVQLQGPTNVPSVTLMCVHVRMRACMCVCT